jgi:alpha-amylase
MVIHDHQPCDNFGWVIEDAFEKAYKPFLDVLEKHPDIKVAMHYSGGLFEWIKTNRPLFFQKIKGLIHNDQIEILSGGFYEPVMSLLSKTDRLQQIQRMNSFIEKELGVKAKGLWLTERVWKPEFVETFLEAGLNYTFLDDNHLKKAGVSQETIKDYYVQENGFNIFCGNKMLRYIIPFASVEEVKKYFVKIKDEKEDVCLTFADDGEKFGFWPKTYDWVYRKKWLEKFFDMLVENKDLVETIKPSQMFSKKEGVLLEDIPSSSYSEMELWANGDFENFLVKYPLPDVAL